MTTLTGRANESEAFDTTPHRQFGGQLQPHHNDAWVDPEPAKAAVCCPE